MTYTPKQLTEILANHQAWLDESGGQRADLRGANLCGANLYGADLCGANLGDTQILQLGPLGSRRDYLVVKKFEDGTTEAMTGCFKGSVKALAEAVEKTHAEHPQYLREYRAAIAYCRAMWEVAE